MVSIRTQENLIPHAICIPFPAQGHINPMLKLSKLLHQKGFHITFVNTEYNHKRLLKSRGQDSLNGPPSFQFETIPDGLCSQSDSVTDSTQDVPSLCESTKKNCLAPFKELIHKLNNNINNNPPVTCIVSDNIMSFTIAAAKEFNIPCALFWTASACSFSAYLHYRHLMDKGIFPLKDESCITNGYLDRVIDWIPGMEGITLKSLPPFLRTTNPFDFMYNYALGEVENARNANALIFNTIYELEHDVLSHLSSLNFPSIYTIGPLHLLEKNHVQDTNLSSIGSNLWTEQEGCLEWLDKQEPNSVVYVNFGSVTVMTPDQLVEFAWGLANSNKKFLWIIRPDLVTGDSAILPQEFVNVTKEVGFLASWCPQAQVLMHPSIGGFLTHSGWNSTLECMSGGVPMICWPFFADQQTNAWFCQNKWRVGMEIDSNVKRGDIEFIVRELMEGVKGKELKDKAIEWKRIAHEATSSSTTSGLAYINLDKLVNDVLIS